MSPLEVEAKFSIPDEQTFRRLLGTGCMAGFSLGNLSVIELRDRYLDTSNRAFWSAGYAFRIRRMDQRCFGTLKGLGRALNGVHRRIEHEIELSGPSMPQDWPAGPVRDLALSLSGDQLLIPLFEIQQTRHQCLLHENSQPVAELNLDRVHVLWAGKVLTSFMELEVELLPLVDESILEAIQGELRNVWGLVPQNRSKFERAWRLLKMNSTSGKEAGSAARAEGGSQVPVLEASVLQQSAPRSNVLPKAPEIDPDDPMSEAGRKVLYFHFQRMLYHEPGTRQGEERESLHDMRVATRRMRAAFRVFGEHFRRSDVDPYLDDLQRTGQALGRVRDLDVFGEQIDAYLNTLPGAQQGGLDGLLAELAVQRQSAREQMLTYLDGRKYARFKERFATFVETEGMGSLPVNTKGGEPRPYRVRHVVPIAIYARLAGVRAYDDCVSVATPPLEQLHALRNACKRLRYTLEFFRRVLGPNADVPIGEVVALQDHLGELQDATVAIRILREFAESGTWGKASGQYPSRLVPRVPSPNVDVYLGVKQQELQHLVDTFPQQWLRLTSAEFSRMVAEAIMVL